MQKERLISLDVLRGITILMMVIVNNPGSWSAVYSPLLHAEWNGCTPTDLVFPFFIFIVGIAIPLAIPNQVLNKKNLIKITIRSLRIICLGIFLNFFSEIYFLELNGIPLLLFRLLLTIVIGYALMGSYNEKWKMYVALFIFSLFMILAFGTEEFSNVRLPGVLQRIGIVYFFSSLVYLSFTIRTQISISAFILLGYWATMTLIPVPGIGAANLEIGTNLSAWIDHIVLGNHVYFATKTWDPEGLFSTLPAIAHGILGLYLGQLLLKEYSKEAIVKKIMGSGILLTFLGLIWSFVYPLNKSLWSSSYVLFTAGLASLFLGLLYYCIDFKNFKKGLTPLVIWGVNPMIVFFLSGIIPRALWMIEWQNPKKTSETINLQQYLYASCIEAYFANPMLASLVGAFTFAAILFGLLAVFYKNKLIFKV